MKMLENKSWIKGKWIIEHDLSDEILKKYYEIFTKFLNNKKTMICSYLSKDGSVVSKAVYINIVENNNEIWINTDESAEFSRYLTTCNKVTGFIFDEELVCGLMLMGEAELEHREDHIKKSWRDELDDWYIEGMYGGDFKVIHFKIKSVKVFFDSKEVWIDLS